MVAIERPMSAEEMRDLPRSYWNAEFDRAAYATVQMSGREFIRRWDDGEFDDLEVSDYDFYSELADLAALSGLGRF